MLCPKCEAEYIEGILLCSDCNISLVYSLPEKLEKSEKYYLENEPEKDHSIKEDYVYIYSPVSSQEVIFIKMILEREEIPYFTKNNNSYKQISFRAEKI